MEFHNIMHNDCLAYIVFMKYFPFFLFSLLNDNILHYVTSENKSNPS